MVIFFQVQSNEDGCQYAVKRSAFRFRGNSDRTRSVREARYHERLCPHPHVLNLVAAWEECDRLYIQTELCSTTLLLHAETQPPGPGSSMIFSNMGESLFSTDAWSAIVLIRRLHPLSQMSLLRGPTCATCSPHCSICILMVSFIWTWNLQMSLWPPLDASSWETLGCCLNSSIKEESLQRMMCRRETRGTWHPSCSVGSMDLPQMFSGTKTRL